MILVIKLSGKVLEVDRHRLSLGAQIAELMSSGHRIVVVHGGGKQLTEAAARLGVTSRMIQGRRITDGPMLEVAKMVFSAINRDLVACLLASGIAAIGLAAFDAGFTRCRRRAPLPIKIVDDLGRESVEDIDFGLVGEIQSLNSEVIHRLWESGWLPVISCLCADSDGLILNINADTLAAEIAASLNADRLVAVSDVDGIYQDPADPSTRLAAVSEEGVRDLLSAGSLSDGMIPKVETALKAIEHGIDAFLLVSGLTPRGLIDGLEGEAGTLLRRRYRRSSLN